MEENRKIQNSERNGKKLPASESRPEL